MTVARSEIVDISVTSWYHVVSKTVRGAFLLQNDGFDRKQWIEDRLEILVGVFAIEVGGFAVLDNHMHLLLNLRSEQTKTWTDEEVLIRWFRIHPPRVNRKALNVTPELLQELTSNGDYVAKIRQRLGDIGWFMKSLKEPIARLANQADGTSGAFWQSRFKSIAILDTNALLAVCAYIDLNVFAAGLSELPEDSPHTSLRQRVRYRKQWREIKDLGLERQSTDVRAMATLDVQRSVDIKDSEAFSFWLCPIQDRRHIDSNARPGLMDGFSLESYLRLIDWTSRIVRKGKAHISRQVSSLLKRLGTDKDRWRSTMRRLFSTTRHTGVAFAFSRVRLREAAVQLGRSRLANLSGCEA